MVCCSFLPPNPSKSCGRDPEKEPRKGPRNEPRKGTRKEPRLLDPESPEGTPTLRMPIKRKQSEAELDAMAERFRTLWREGNVMRPWLRKHHALIRDLVDDGWSWAGVAEALTRAGITWRTRRPWSGEDLRREVDRAAVPLKSRRRSKAPSPAAPIPATAETITPPTADAAIGPKFRPARPKPYDPPRPLTEADERERAAVQKKFYG